jgi:uncharacterized protein
MDPSLAFAAAAGALPPLCVGWGLVEKNLFVRRRHRIPVLPEGAGPLKILQVSDTHLRLGNRRMEGFLDSLAADPYDLVLATGDMLGEAAAVETCAAALNRLQGRLGRMFVLGSSDYYVPQFKGYFDYFIKRQRHGRVANRTSDFRRLLMDRGWTDLTNLTVTMELGGVRTQITGLDDPYLHRDDRSLLVRSPQARFALCVVHDPAPYLDAARAGFDLIVAGHTHGGQVRMPFAGALVTNSKLPRQYARWQSQIEAATLFVTPGLGTGRYAPFRFMCRPEASVLELVSRTG